MAVLNTSSAAPHRALAWPYVNRVDAVCIGRGKAFTVKLWTSLGDGETESIMLLSSSRLCNKAWDAMHVQSKRNRTEKKKQDIPHKIRNAAFPMQMEEYPSSPVRPGQESAALADPLLLLCMVSTTPKVLES